MSLKSVRQDKPDRDRGLIISRCRGVNADGGRR
jgi:hypothetical protein